MDRRRNFEKTLGHETPGDIILDLGGNPLSTMEGDSQNRLLEYLGYGRGPSERPLFGKTRKIDERILIQLDIDTRSVGTILTPSDSQFEILDENTYMDEWGITRKYTGMYWDITEYPLKGAEKEDLEKFKWPDPESLDIDLISQYAKKAGKLHDETDYVICGEHPVYGIFELGCWMCGFDDFLLKMVLDGDFVKRFFEIILEYQKKVIEIYYSAVGPYIHYTSSGDDFATQSSLFMSPGMFREYIKPYLKERIDFTKKFTDAAFLHHSCGNVSLIIPDLIDIGVEILNPIQPAGERMKPENLKNSFGKDIVFHGGLDTQDVLPYGDRESVTAAVEELVSIMNRDGGYIFAAAHNIQEDVPGENVVHMFKAARKAGRNRKS